MKEKTKSSEINAIIKFIICSVLLVIIWGGYIIVSQRLEHEIKYYADDFSWMFQVDSVEESKKELVFNGFAFRLNTDAKEDMYELVLRDIDTDKAFFLKMDYVMREDVNEYFHCQYDYRMSGFVSRIKTKRLDLEKKNYEVLLRVKGEKTAYMTGVYLSKGELLYANPKEYSSLDVVGTDLEKIVEEGVLRVYRPEHKMYVYQYDGDLYWIAEQEYSFKDNDTLVQIQMDTTQTEKLPMTRLEKNLLWDDKAFMFTTHELKNINTGKYRVAKMKLPTEYALTRMWTGNYDGKWIWQSFFRPWYEFSNR